MPLVLSMWRDMPGTPSEGDVQETSHTDVQATSWLRSSQCGGEVALLWAPHPIKGGRVLTREDSNTWWPSWGAISKPTPGPACYCRQLQSRESPASLKELGSRAQTVRGGEPNKLPLPPAPPVRWHSKSPWPELLSGDWDSGAQDHHPNHLLKPRVVNLWEGGPMWLVWSVSKNPATRHFVCARLYMKPTQSSDQSLVYMIPNIPTSPA